MKVYLFFLDTELVPDYILTCGYAQLEEIQYGEHNMILYASTPDKKLRDKFQSLRIKDFILTTTEMTEEEYNHRFDYTDLKYTYIDKLCAITNELELYNIYQNWGIMIMEPTEVVNTIDFFSRHINSFRPDYREALMTLGITTFYATLLDSDTSDEYLLYANVMEDGIFAVVKRDTYSDDPDDTFSLSISPHIDNLYISCYSHLYKTGKKRHK